MRMDCETNRLSLKTFLLIKLIIQKAMQTCKKGTLATKENSKSPTDHLFLFSKYNCTTIGFIEILNLYRSQEQLCRTSATIYPYCTV